MNFNFGGIEKLAKAALAFGKKNLPSLMVGGSVGLQWLSLILMMVEAPKAADQIKETERQREEDDQPKMTKLEKTAVYGSNCWPSITSMIGANVLEVCAHKNMLNHVGELYMLAQLYKDDGDKLRKQILKEDGGEKKLEEYCDQIFIEDHPVEEVIGKPESYEIPNGETLVFDETTGVKFSVPIDKLRYGFDEFNEMMRERWKDAYEKAIAKKLSGKYGDAFFSDSDNVWGSKSESEDIKSVIYVRASLDEFLACIGEKSPHSTMSDLGELLEFHYYGTGPAADYNKLVDIEKYKNPNSGKIVYAVIKSLRQRGLLFIL